MNIQENFHGLFLQPTGSLWAKQSSLILNKVAYINDTAN
jgi:hypothetical protein